MKLSHVIVRLSWMALAAIVAVMTIEPASAQSADPAAQAADRAFVQAAARSDNAKVATMLDGDFTWTDVAGKSQSSAEIARALPKPLIANEAAAQVEYHAYGSVASAQVHNGKQHTLRMWVKRPAGWRLLAYHEVQLRDTPPPPPAATVAAVECINPCRSIPFEPKSANQRAVATSFSALETSVTAHDAERWGSMIGDEFIAVSSGADQLLDKKTRKAQLAQASMAGLVPVPLVNARMTELGDAIVMESQHQPVGAKPMHATRLWVKRGGVWMETISYQTTIQAAPMPAR
jgi:hypothetical protein